MPYIKSDDGRREALRNGEPALLPGELNYQIYYYVKHNGRTTLLTNQYKIIKKFVEQFLGNKPNYQRYNDMTGCLIRCEREIERRLNRNTPVLFQIMDSYDDEIADYENMKIDSNGDVE